MKPAILGLFVSLACRVHSMEHGDMIKMSHEASSLDVSAVRDSCGSNHGVASAIKWRPGVMECRQRINQGIACELEYNQRRKEMSLRENPSEQQGMQKAVSIAPSQQSMQRTITEYSKDELLHIAQEVGDLLNAENSEDSAANSLVPIKETYQGVPGSCGQLKVYDSENPGQVLLQNCCHLDTSTLQHSGRFRSVVMNCDCCNSCEGICLLMAVGIAAVMMCA